VSEFTIPMPLAPYTGMLEGNPGERMAAAADLHRPDPDDHCPECAKPWPCPTADALSGGIYLVKGFEGR
jgi:hypothetical protein